MPYIVYYSTEVVITQPLTRAIIYNSPIILYYSRYLRLFTIYDWIYDSISYSLHDALRNYHGLML